MAGGHEVNGVAAVHRTGLLEIGDIAVIVATSAATAARPSPPPAT